MEISRDSAFTEGRREARTERASEQVGDAMAAVRSAQRAAEDALDHLSETVQDVRARATPVSEGVSELAEEAAPRSIQALPRVLEDLPDNYPEFVEYLREPSSMAPLLSPRRFSEVLNIDLQTLAEQAHVHRNTVARAPGSKALQDFIREALRVIKAATDLNGDLRRALFWYRTEPLAAFGYQSAERLVVERRADDVLSYIASLEAGAAG